MSDKFYNLLEYITIGASLHDEYGNFIYANPIFYNIFKTSNEKIKLKKFNSNIIGINLDNSDYIIDWINTNYKNINNKIIKVISNGIRWIKLNTIKLKNGEEFYIITYEDITDTIHYTYLYEEIFNNIDTGIMILENKNDEYYLKSINPYGKQTCSLNDNDLDKNIKKLNLPLLNDKPLLYYINEVIKNNKSINLSFAKCIKKDCTDEQWRTISIHKTESNQIIILFHNVTDIMNYKNIIGQQNKMKSVFLSNMSHEIRSPINAIVGFIDILDKSEEEEEIKESINIIKSSSLSLIKLLDDISDISKIEAGKISINKNNFNVNNIIKEICDIKKIKLNDKIELKCNVDLDKELILLSDQYRFKQILSNLIDNSIKFTNDGSIEIGYYIENGYIIFYIEDTGIGISDENKKLVFNRFHKAVKSKIGTGLGLDICKQLVNLLGGDIWFKSKYGAGSIFYFKLPYQKVNIKKTKNVKLKSNTENVDLSDKKILLVEDVEFNIKLILSYLESTKANIIVAVSGNDALLKYNEHKNDLSLILMDIQLPEMDGTEVTQIIRTIDDDIPIIAQTAYAIREEIEDILQYGFNDLIKKPIIKEDLINIILKYI